MNLPRLAVLFILAIMISSDANAQENDWQSKSIEEVFTLARTTALSSNYEQSKKMLAFALQQKPDYHDARILLGRIYAWEGNRKEARNEFEKVLLDVPDHEDAMAALADTEIWDEQYEKALRLIDQALLSNPDSEEWLLRHAFTNLALERFETATASLDQLLLLNPDHSGAQRLQQALKQRQMTFTASLSYNIDFINRANDPTEFVSAQLSKKNNSGSYAISVNYANRFNNNGWQGEFELYPKLSPRVYSYVNYGYSKSNLFPRHRIGGEVFIKANRVLEVSTGFRYLFFSTKSHVSIYTGSIAFYAGDYLISARSFLAFDVLHRASFSTNLFLRKYYNDGVDYVMLSATAGFSPDERRLQTGNGITDQNLYHLSVQRLGISWNKTTAKNFTLVPVFEISRQEVGGSESNHVYLYRLGISVRKSFN